MSTKSVEYISCDICGFEKEASNNLNSASPDYIRKDCVFPVFAKHYSFSLEYDIEFVTKDLCINCLRKITNVRCKSDSSSNKYQYPFSLEIIDGTDKSHSVCKFESKESEINGSN